MRCRARTSYDIQPLDLSHVMVTYTMGPPALPLPAAAGVSTLRKCAATSARDAGRMPAPPMPWTSCLAKPGVDNSHVTGSEQVQTSASYRHQTSAGMP